MMPFFKKPAFLQQRTAPYIIYSILFLLILIPGYGIVYATGHTMIGKNDNIGQYYEAFLYVGRYLRSLFTEGIRHYDLSIGMGEDVIGCLNYYGLGDPFYLLAVFARGRWAYILFDFLYFFRLYLAGLAFVFLCGEFSLDPVYSAVSAQTYIFASFGLSAVSKIPAWGCVMIFLPLMLAGCERCFHSAKGGGRILCLSALYGALCGFYMIYMAGIFLMVYCPVRLLFIRGRGAMKSIALTCLYCALWFAAGMLLAAPFLFPAVTAFLFSERSGGDVTAILTDYRNYLPSLKFIRETFSYPISGNVYFQGVTIAELVCALAAVFMKPLLPGGKDDARLRQCALAVTVCALTFSLPITGYVFNGFSESYTRWAVIIHLIFALVMACVLSIGGKKVTEEPKDAKISFRTAALVLSAFALINVLVNVVTFFAPFGNNRLKKLIERDRVEECVDSPVIHSRTVMEDPGLFRVDAAHYSLANDRPENAAMLYGYHGITYWFSMVNGYTQQGLNAMNGSRDNWRSSGLWGDGATQTMAGVRYYLTTGEEVPDYYELKEVFTWGGEKWRVYENLHFYGLTYVRQPGQELPKDREGYDRLYEELYRDNIAIYGGYTGVYEKDRYGVRVNAFSDDCEAVIALPYTGAFTAYVDGVETETEVADGIYISVPLKGEGGHDIILEYRSRPFEAGVAVCICTLICIILVAAYSHFIARKDKA